MWIDLFAPIGARTLKDNAYNGIQWYFGENSDMLKEWQKKYYEFDEQPLPLFTWAETTNESAFYFFTKETDPNEWRIIHCDDMDYHIYEKTPSELLLGLFTGEITDSFTIATFPENELKTLTLEFIPWYSPDPAKPHLPSSY